MIRIALDTNILAYLAGVARIPSDAPKVAQVRSLMAGISGQVQVLVPVQALGELFVVLSRAGTPAPEARAILLEFADALEVLESSASVMKAALDLVVDHKLQYWDALILSAAAEAGATLLLSEDMQDGFVWRGVTLANPFAATPHRKLAALIG
ncbi:MAG: PIN domain-containing protein [Chakrabartia sp.]